MVFCIPGVKKNALIHAVLHILHHYTVVWKNTQYFPVLHLVAGHIINELHFFSLGAYHVSLLVLSAIFQEFADICEPIFTLERFFFQKLCFTKRPKQKKQCLPKYLCISGHGLQNQSDACCTVLFKSCHSSCYCVEVRCFLVGGGYLVLFCSNLSSLWRVSPEEITLSLKLWLEAVELHCLQKYVKLNWQ